MNVLNNINQITFFPILASPVNFFVILIGSHCNLSDKYVLNVIPKGALRWPELKPLMAAWAYVSSSSLHFPRLCGDDIDDTELCSLPSRDRLQFCPVTYSDFIIELWMILDAGNIRITYRDVSVSIKNVQLTDSHKLERFLRIAYAHPRPSM